MKKLLLIIFLIPLLSIAQVNKGALYGKIYDEKKSPIAFATIVLQNTKYYATSDENGIYKIENIPFGNYMVEISSIGYKKTVLSIKIQGNVQKNFSMKTETENLSEITIKGEKTARGQSQKALNIASVDVQNVLTKSIEIKDVLNKNSGVQIRNSGSLGDRSEISINGLKGNAIRKYIDGIPLEYLYPRLNISNIPLSNIKRIDIYKGVLPVSVGTDALGGGVNIITSQKKKSYLTASYSYGSFNTNIANLDFALFSKKDNYIKFFTNWSYSDNDFEFETVVLESNKKEKVKRFHDRYRYLINSLEVGTINKKWADKASISFNFTNLDKQIQNGVQVESKAIGAAFYEGQNYGVNLKYEKKITDRIEAKTHFNVNQQNLKLVDTARAIYSWSGKIIGYNIQPGELSTGGSNQDQTIDSYVNRTNFDFNSDNEKHQFTLNNFVAFQRRKIENHLNPAQNNDNEKLLKNILGAQYTFKPIEKLDLSVAGKYFYNELVGLENENQQEIKVTDENFGWNGSFRYKFSDKFLIRGSYEDALRIPDFYEYFGDGIIISPNTALVPERSENLNLGFILKSKQDIKTSYILKVGGFLRQQKELIRLNPNIPAHYENVEKVRNKGFETELTVKFLKYFTLNTNVTYQSSEFRSSYENQDDFIGTQVPNIPQFFTNTELIFSYPSLFQEDDTFKAFIYHNYVDEYAVIPVTKSSIRNPDVYVPTQQIINTGITYIFPQKTWTASFIVNNLLDNEVYDFYKVPKPTRNYHFKLIYNINFKNY
ncbi:TonB-dependent receptor [Aureivirga sp. CE67]|uniref:TonB-dependent receptor n=1 Tax=Aureivirga sp. CE67 TaxID=1788983 RepID=UPI0018CADB30|nr:TonB-dependent receptor [Aureivirga sp. CE67]